MYCVFSIKIYDDVEVYRYTKRISLWVTILLKIRVTNTDSSSMFKLKLKL